MQVRVTPRSGEPTEKFLKRFKRMCSRSGIFREMKKRRFYQKPSEQRRRRERETLRQIRKAERRKERMKQRLLRR